MKPSIGLLGANGAGKTTIADYLVAEHGYRKLSFAEPLRELASLNAAWRDDVRVYGYDGAKRRFPNVRQYLIDLGEGIRKYDPVYFVKALAQKITDMDPERPWVVDDVRKQVEVNFLNDMGFRFAVVARAAHGASREEVAPEGLTLPTEFQMVWNYFEDWVLTTTRLDNVLRHASWALGTPKEEKDGASSPPVLEQPDADQGGEGLPAEREGDTTPHWCSRCEAEWVRWGNFFPPAVSEARARWYATEGGRGRDEVERHGGVATVRDGEEDAVRGDSPGPGGVVPDTGD